jgi:MFS family permease
MTLAAKQLQKAKTVYREYPKQFWLLIAASFVDRLGGALVFTFFAIYITNKFGVGLTEVGFVSVIWGVTGIAGNFVGGAMADKFGRKGVVVFSLVMSASSSVALGLVTELWMLYAVVVVSGTLASVGEPAQNAMISDMLPKEQRAEGYSIHRVAFNVAVVIGPVIGGFIATRSYLLLFLADAVTSGIMALFVAFILKETLVRDENAEEESTSEAMGSYGKIFRDKLFMAFIGMGMVAQFVYFQMYMTLPVFLNKSHDIPPSGYGYIMSLNATMVVLLQFWITRKLRSVPPMLTLALACLFYMVGFGMYGFVSVFALFLVAMAFITIGEMVFFPTSQAFVAELAPENMRARYMALYGFSFSIPSSFGTLFAGLLSDNVNPFMIWYIAGMGGLLAALGYLGIHRAITGSRSLDVAVQNPITQTTPAIAATSE